MHTWVKRAAVVGVVMVAQVVVTTGALAGGNGDGGLNDDVNPSDQQFTHAAQFVAAAGGGAGGQGGDNSCDDLPRPDDWPEGQPWETHYEWNSYEMSDGTWSVFLNCVRNGENVPNNGEDIDFPPADEWSVVWYRLGVVPGDPEEMASEILAQAIANLNPGVAAIHTDPPAGQPSYVGIETFFWLDAGVYGPQTVTASEGPVVGAGPLIEVTITAVPLENGQITWDTGNGLETCASNARCPHEYDRSSAGQGAADAYRVTATYQYEGSYVTRVMGAVIDSGPLGLISRTSETTLAVAEAQALNTGG